jgi:chromosomal replication initiation ATPase DnaA
MHHTIKLDYGDTITITAPALPPVAIKVAQKRVQMEEVHKYKIFQRVCDAFDITVEDIISKSRKQTLVLARFIIAYDLVVNHKLQLSTVGRLMCRDHTSIIYYVQTFRDQVKHNDAKLAAARNQILFYEQALLEEQKSENFKTESNEQN